MVNLTMLEVKTLLLQNGEEEVVGMTYLIGLTLILLNLVLGLTQLIGRGWVRLSDAVAHSPDH